MTQHAAAGSPGMAVCQVHANSSCCYTKLSMLALIVLSRSAGQSPARYVRTLDHCVHEVTHQQTDIWLAAGGRLCTVSLPDEEQLVELATCSQDISMDVSNT